MQYNIPEFKRRIKALDGGLVTVAEKYGASTLMISKLLDPNRKPRLKSMQKLAKAILDAEQEEAQTALQHPEFFLAEPVSSDTK